MDLTINLKMLEQWKRYRSIMQCLPHTWLMGWVQARIINWSSEHKIILETAYHLRYLLKLQEVSDYISGSQLLVYFKCSFKKISRDSLHVAYLAVRMKHVYKFSVDFSHIILISIEKPWIGSGDFNKICF